MQLEQKQALSQRLALTPQMRQSLQCLAMTVPELNEYAQDLALSNPVLEVQTASYYELVSFSENDEENTAQCIELRESIDVGGNTIADRVDSEWLTAKEQSLSNYLDAQLGQMALVDDRMRALCRFLIGCLDTKGYLDCPLEALSVEIGCDYAELEQALYTLQMLDPPGIGARNLRECLTLQLAQGKNFNRYTLGIVTGGLHLLPSRDYSALSRLLKITAEEAQQAAECILSLNPIPARGFADAHPENYAVPDALFRIEGETLVVEMNERVFPKISVNEDYLKLAGDAESVETASYIRNKISEAELLIKSVQARSDTVLRLFLFVAQKQRDFFFGGEIAPVTMQEAAAALAISDSTVSRTVKNKYILFGTQIFSIRDFFTAAVSPAVNNSVSVQTILKRIQYLILSEDKTKPLTDEAIRRALEESGISVSRRMVAFYRERLSIPASGKRKCCVR